ALLRRLHANQAVETSVAFGDIRIDKEKHMIFKGNEEINLPKKEFKLFSLLSSKPGKVFTREYILEQVWGDEVVVGDRTIDVHIRKLREKIGEDYFKTVKGVGYKFDF
ncbi:MAG: response regulator transcription factor, partial [Bacteroidia bacterium]|nr:response regulator transcription factor [Bacteroidia bacterium]